MIIFVSRETKHEFFSSLVQEKCEKFERSTYFPYFLREEVKYKCSDSVVSLKFLTK